MQNHSLTKLKVWQKSKRIILSKTELGSIAPERAEKILSFIKKTLRNIDTIEGLGMYLDMLGKRFPELSLMIEEFKLGEQEKFDVIVGTVLEKLMVEGHFELAEELIDKIKGVDKIDERIATVKNFSPQEFEAVYKEVFEA